MSKINVLPKFVQNVIASGQVVDRPASVVKELIENSIDAGAMNITIYINESGLARIAVVDDGVGIEHEDVLTAFKSYSTSKISKIEDLDSITTMGFRGEALAAIASISCVNIWTKTHDSDLGTRASLVYGEESLFEYCATGTQGTKIEITNLYGNVPNKKRFLKRPSVELSEITTIVSKLILANPYIAFTYVVDDNEVLSTLGKGLSEAIFILYGRSCLENSFIIENEFNGVSVVGLVGEASYLKPNSTYQTTIVNCRYVKDDTVAVAVKNAFDGLLMTREYPFFVLDITVQPDLIDVNIHPDKMEIKFINKQDVYRAVYTPIKKHFEQQQMLSNARTLVEQSKISSLTELTDKATQETLSIEATEDIIDKPQTQEFSLYTNPDDSYLPGSRNFGELTQLKLIPHQNSSTTDDSEKYVDRPITSYDLDPAKTPGVHEDEETPDNFYFKTFDNNFTGNSSCNSQTQNFQTVEALPEVSEEEFAEFLSNGLTNKNNSTTFSSASIKTRLFGNYVVAETQNGSAIIVIDQHAAHERILYDKYMSNLITGPIMVQNLNVPIEFTLTAEQCEFLETVQEKLEGYGFEFKITEKDCLSVTGVPLEFAGLDIPYFFRSLFADHQNNFSLDNINRFYIAKKACKSAIKAGMELSSADVSFIMKKLDENKNLRCPHGRPIAIAIKRTAFDKAFKRIL